MLNQAYRDGSSASPAMMTQAVQLRPMRLQSSVVMRQASFMGGSPPEMISGLACQIPAGNM